MAILKCKMCGGDLHFEEGASTCVCEYCGNTNTLPVVGSDQEMNLFNRANHFRMINEFDRAITAYERILDADDMNAEAHWGIVLSRYGIEYVEDPFTHERIPTCHRVQMTSILSDPDYHAAVEQADAVAKTEYKAQAERIAEIQKGILAISSQEKPYDVFICYKESDENGSRTVDSTLAQEIYYGLTEAGYRVFFSRITLEDKLGQQYEPYIFAALNSAKVMVVVGTKPEYFNAVWVKNEWSRYLALMKNDRHRLLIPCYRDMDPYDLPDELSMLQSQDMSKIGFMQDLLRGIKKVLTKEAKKTAQQESVIVQQGATGTTSNAQVMRGNMALEDQEWGKADQFFEEALNLDPECAEAYIGKLLTQKKQRNWDTLIGAWAGQYESQTTERLSACTADTDHIEKIVEEYKLTGYLDADVIRKLYVYDFGYDSALSCREQQKEKQLREMSSERHLQRAKQYAKGETKKQIEDGITKVTEKLDQRVSQARSEDATSIENVKTDYTAHVKQADHKAAELNKDALAQREKDYQSAIEEVDSAKDIRSYELVLAKLNVIGGYKDASKLASRCRDEIARLKEEQHKEEERQAEIRRQEEARLKRAKKKKKTVIGIIVFALIACVIGYCVFTTVILPKNKYNAAVKLKESGNYEAAITAFKEMNGYKDSDEQITDCENLEKYESAVTLMEQGDYEAAITAFDAIYTYKDSTDKIKECRYKAAIALMEIGEYEKAIETFKIILDYRDSSGKIKECETAKKESEYDAAVALMESGEYEKAIEVFKIISDYSDSSEKIKECETAVKDNKYDTAVTLKESGDYEAAIKAFKTLDGYKDSKEQIKECETAINDIKYNEAIELMEREDFEGAISSFEALNGYKDSGEKIEVCKEAAREQYKQFLLANAEVGKTVILGAYEQDSDRLNGKEDIEWIVLDVKDNTALIASKYALDYQPYYEEKSGLTWEHCPLRKWLNEVFLEEAFDGADAERVITTTVVSGSNPEYATDPGEDTEDKVFLLSIEEVEKLFASDEARQCKLTDFIKWHYGVSEEDMNSWWWLRSPGDGNRSIAVVNADGSVNYGGIIADRACVRPALWINLDS